MSTGETEIESPEAATAAASDEASSAAPPKVKLDLEVEITDAGPCKKHLKVAVSRADIARHFDQSFGEMRKEAAVPGFRPGRAPRQLVERRFKKQVSGQVKQNLLMATLEQLDEEHKLKAIATPQLDVDAIDLPDDGPMRFEMDVEVQPDIKLPAYKALSVRRPMKQIGEADIDRQLITFRERSAQLVPKLEGGAEVGDFVTADLIFHRDGRTHNEAKEVQFRLQPELRFQDGRVPDLAGALTGAKPGDVREASAEVGSASADPELRNQQIGVTIKVLDLKQLRLPEVDAAFIATTGFDTLDDLRTALRGMLERRFEFQQRQEIRKGVLDDLLAQTPFDLPADLVTRQERSTLRNRIAELRQGGLGDAEIRAREAELRSNAHESTTRSLKEFFLLSQIADAEGIKVEDEDFNQEVEAIAARNDENPRRVRARIEKDGLEDALATQILERKALDRILEYVKFEEVPLVEEQAVETLDRNASAEPPATGADDGGEPGSSPA